MGSITAAEVNQLRKRTGAGMMDCKKALQEADGNIETAIEVLRKKGQKVADKRSGRDACEGIVMTHATGDAKHGILLMLNCETDFVAKNSDFIELFNSIMKVAIDNLPAGIDELNLLQLEGSNLTVKDRIIEEVGKIGEKIDVSAFEVIEAEKVYCYNHPGNRVTSMVGVNADCNPGVANDIAMQIAAMAPVALDKDDVPKDIIDKEIEIGKQQALNEGKPAELAEKIALGKLNKYYKENTLLNQQFIKDNKKTVKQFLQENNANVKVFKRGVLGD